MVNESTRKRIMDEYGIDVIKDALLADDYHVVFCFDFKKLEQAEVMIVAGNLTQFGIKNGERIFVKDIIPYLDYDNPVADVIGKEFYLEYLFSMMGNAKKITEMYFPFKMESGLMWVACTCQHIKSDESVALVYGRVNWITEDTPDAIRYYESLYKDEMTNLYTKQALIYHLKQAKPTNHSYGLYFDIDNFKRINDIFGHKYGDEYLRLLGCKMCERPEQDVHCYRLGGDEFFIYLINSTEEEAYRKAMQIIYDIERLNEKGQQAEVSASIGIIPIIGSDFDIENMLDLSDRTMYHAKGKGKGNISYARDV